MLYFFVIKWFCLLLLVSVLASMYYRSCQRYDPCQRSGTSDHKSLPELIHTRNAREALQKASCAESSISCLSPNKTQYLFYQRHGISLRFLTHKHTHTLKLRGWLRYYLHVLSVPQINNILCVSPTLPLQTTQNSTFTYIDILQNNIRGKTRTFHLPAVIAYSGLPST